MKFIYCPYCGERLAKKLCGDEGYIPFCEKCNRPWFSVSYPCVICLCLDDNNNIALIKQRDVSDKYVCVAGYVKEGETIESTAKREVEEETGLIVLGVQYINSYYYEKRDNLMFGFVCRVEKSDFNISDEVDEAYWFTLDEAESLLRQGSVAYRLLCDYLRG